MLEPVMMPYIHWAAGLIGGNVVHSVCVLSAFVPAFAAKVMSCMIYKF